MRQWPFHLAAGILFGVFLADVAKCLLWSSGDPHLSLLGGATLVFLIPHLDGALGNIQKIKAHFNREAGGIEIQRKVAQAERTADKAVKSLAEEFPLNLSAVDTAAKAQSTGEPWREMIRVSDLIVRRLAERLGEDPNLLEEISLPAAVSLAVGRGLISERQATALKGFHEARQTLIEICYLMKANTPISVNEQAWRLKIAGEQLVSRL